MPNSPSSPRPRKKKAFISYSRRYEDWVKPLHRNLERHFGEGSVFLDVVDLLGGPSYVPKLQSALEQAEHLLIVVTPESLASPRVLDEFHQVYASTPDWKGRVQLLRLVPAPSLPFLRDKQEIDFTRADGYGDRFVELVRVLEGLGRTVDVALPDGFEVALPPRAELIPDAYWSLIRFLCPWLERKADRRSLAAELLGDGRRLEEYEGADVRANALLVRSRSDDEPIPAALRLLRAVEDLFGEEESFDREGLASLRKSLDSTPRPKGPEGLLRRYLESVVDDHARLVRYFRRSGEDALLEHIYVRLSATLGGWRKDGRPLRSSLEKTLRSEGSDPLASGSNDKRVALGNALTLEDLCTLTPEQHTWVTRRWVVQGHPGSGKTTFARHFARELAKRVIEGEAESASPPPIPIFVSLATLVRSNETLLQWLERKVSKRSPDQPAEGLGRVLDAAGQEGRLVVLLDGLDEVPKSDRDDALALLRELGRRWPESTLIVTSRLIGYESPDTDFREVELLPLDEDARLGLLSRWLSDVPGQPNDALAREALTHFRSDRDLWELSGVPLYLTLMAILWSRGEKPDSRRSELYGQVVKLLIEDGYNAAKGAREELPNPKAVRATLAEIALDWTKEERIAEACDDLEDRLFRPPLRKLLGVPEWRSHPRRFLKAVATATDMLAAHDGEDAPWRFWHKGLLEYWTAVALHRRWKAARSARAGRSKRTDVQAGIQASIQAVLEEIKLTEGNENAWAEAFALLTGLIASEKGASGEADALILKLAEKHESVALRALATARDLSPDTFKQLLTLTDDADERGEVIAGLVERIVDPYRAVLLLGQLAEGNRRASDLYFIDQALSEAAKQHPEVAPLAEDCRTRLFDAFEPPPEDLFGPVATCIGIVPFWADIQAGTFWMGSPVDEEDRDDDEGPRHEVTLSAFRMSVVPVSVAQFAAFDSTVVERQAEHAAAEPNRYPVTDVDWWEAWAFCQWAGVRLPTEAQWEYACRGEQQTRYFSGDDESDLARVGWYYKNSEGRLHASGELPANSWGLHDVHGNVDEWCWDRWSAEYSSESQRNPAGPERGAVRVIRGGSFENSARNCRSAFRLRRHPGNRWFSQGYLGFRVALSPRLGP